MLLMGIGLVGGAVATQIGTALAGLDQQVGTNGSAAAFVLGAGLIVASLSPSAPIAGFAPASFTASWWSCSRSYQHCTARASTSAP